MVTQAFHVGNEHKPQRDIKVAHLVALPTKNIKVINSFYKGMHDMQSSLRL